MKTLNEYLENKNEVVQEGKISDAFEKAQTKLDRGLARTFDLDSMMTDGEVIDYIKSNIKYSSLGDAFKNAKSVDVKLDSKTGNITVTTPDGASASSNGLKFVSYNKKYGDKITHEITTASKAIRFLSNDILGKNKSSDRNWVLLYKRQESPNEKVNKAINEAADLISALEAVGAMYGIPSYNIIADDTTNKITVHEDMIIAPPVSAQGQNKAIVQAVGTVLDYISQRIDAKLNDFQANNISNAQIPDSVTPSDANPGQSYFGDEDDIAADIDTNASPNVSANDMSGNEVNVPAEIQESAYHVNMMARLGDTTHLGYDLLRHHGFDFVKPIDSFIQEASEEKEEGKKKKKIKIEDIKHMKFDNKGILDAIKYLNAARDEQDNVKAGTKIDKQAFVNSQNYQKAIKALNSQFNCSMNIKFIDTKGSTAMTEILPAVVTNKITVSKSKGFQLNGMPVNIYVLGSFMDRDDSPNDNELFGQNFVSVILHELFHNIYMTLAKDNVRMGMSMAMAMALASATDDMKEKRIILTNYVDSLDAIRKGSFMDKIAKKRMVKQLIAMSAMSENGVKKLKEESEKNSGKVADEYIDKLIKSYKRANKQLKPYKGLAISYAILGALSATVGIVMSGISGGVFGLPFLIGIGGALLMDAGNEYSLKQYDSNKRYEEYWCDLFAGMYNLPVKFFVGGSLKKYVPNDFNRDKLNELAKLEKEFHRNIRSTYPTTLERNHAAVTIAKNILEDKTADEALKKYAKWVVDNFDSVHNTDIQTIYNQTTFDPKEAENLDKHLQELIEDNNIVTTEAYNRWLGKE